MSGVYLYILNIEPHLRSKVNNFLIVQIHKSSVDSGEKGVEMCYKRLVKDLNHLIENGINLSIGKNYPFRFIQFRADKKEVNHLMLLPENFAFSTFFSPYTLVTQKDRKTAKSSNELMPIKVGLRDKERYELDVEASKAGNESHGLKGNSILNDIKYFHVTKHLVPCLDHDLFAGTFREDVALILNEMVNRNIISNAWLERSCFIFKEKLFGSDKRSWLPKIRENSFKVKVSIF